MDFGRLPNLEGVDLSLPPLHDRSRRVLAASARAIALEQRALAPADATSASTPAPPPAMWLRTGAPAWARKDWLGRFYPRGTADNQLLHAYAQRLTAIELNASYYRIPTEETLDAWAADVPDTFHFCPKVHQSITHRRALAESIPEAQDFARRFLRLGRRLGPALLQLPPWFDLEGLPALEALIEALPGELRVAIEFRHPTWFHRHALRDPVFAMLERLGAGAVITDVAGRRDVCHGSIPAPFVFLRYVGNGNGEDGLHPTDLSRAEAWLARLIEWRSLGLEDAYFFAHQPDDALAPEVLSHFATCARALGVDVPALTLAPAQLALFGDAAPAKTAASKGKSPASRASPVRR